MEALGEEDLQRGRGRQGLLPDFKLELPTPEGDHETKLAELKVIGAVESWYPRSGQFQGWVVGSFQEASKDLHHLLECLADSKLKARGLARGREGDEWERSLILHEFRRELSLTAAKAVSACLLGKVSKLGDGHRQAARRRAWAKHESERREAALKAHWAANVQGRGLHRKGRFFIPW